MQKMVNSLFDDIIKTILNVARTLDLSKIYKNCCPYCANPIDNYQTHCSICKSKLPRY